MASLVVLPYPPLEELVKNFERIVPALKNLI